MYRITLALILLSILNRVNYCFADSIKEPKEEHRLKITLGCEGFGFLNGGWDEFDSVEREEACDRDRLRRFRRALGVVPPKMLPGEAPPDPKLYDMDKDGVVTCQDFYAWKAWMRDWYGKGHRKSDGSQLKLEECAEAT